MTPATTAQVRIWSARRHSRGSGWEARWSVGGKARSKSFATRNLADTHLSKLRTAANEGKPFDLRTGLPGSMARQDVPTCLELGRALVSSKWADWAGTSRGSAADGLRYALTALVPAGKVPPDRPTLVTPIFRELRRVPGKLPDGQVAALRWFASNSWPVDTLDRATVTAALTAIEINADGTRCVPSTATQRRSMLTQLLGRAIDAELLPADILIALSKVDGQRRGA